MLNTTEAYAFAFRAIKEKPLFWLSIMLMSIVLSSIADWQKNDVIVVLLLGIIDLVLYVGIINVAIKTFSDKEYSFEDLLVKPRTFMRYIAIVTLMVLAGMVIYLPLIFGLPFITKSADSFLIFYGLFVIGTLGMSYVLIRLWFAPYYLLHQDISILQSLKAAWIECTYKISLSLLIAILWIIVINIPFIIIDSQFEHLRTTSLTTPILLLSTVHLYMQLQWRKNKSEDEN